MIIKILLIATIIIISRRTKVSFLTILIFEIIKIKITTQKFIIKKFIKKNTTKNNHIHKTDKKNITIIRNVFFNKYQV